MFSGLSMTAYIVKKGDKDDKITIQKIKMKQNFIDRVTKLLKLPKNRN